MKYCPNCGEPLSTDPVFCPNCGNKIREAAEAANDNAQAFEEAAPQPFGSMNEGAQEVFASSEPAPKKKKAKAGVIIAIVLAALLAAAAALYFTGALKKLLPSSRAKLALAEKALVEEYLDKYFEEQNRIFGKDGKLDIKADMDITLALDTQGAGIFSQIGIISSLLDQFKLNIGVDASEDGNNLNLGLIYKNNPLLDGKLLIGKENVGLYIPQLDGKYYTMSNEALAKLIAQESDGEEIDASSVSSLDLSPLDEAKTRKEVLELLAKLSNVSTDKNTVIEKDSEVKLFNGSKTAACTDYTVTPSAEEIEKAINDIADYLADENCYIAQRLNGFVKLVQAEEEGTPKTVSELLKENAKDTAEELASKHAAFKVSMDGDTIISQRLITDDEVYGIDTEKTESTERNYAYRASGDKEAVHYDYVLNTSDSNRRAGSVKVNGEDYTDMEIVFDFDMTKTSAIKTNPGNVSVKIEGTEYCKVDITANGDAMEHVISIPVEALSALGAELTDVHSITLKANVTPGSAIEPPSGIEPTDLSDKSAEEISQIFESMIEQIGNVLINVFSPF